MYIFIYLNKNTRIRRIARVIHGLMVIRIFYLIPSLAPLTNVKKQTFCINIVYTNSFKSGARTTTVRARRDAVIHCSPWSLIDFLTRFPRPTTVPPCNESWCTVGVSISIGRSLPRQGQNSTATRESVILSPINTPGLPKRLSAK